MLRIEDHFCGAGGNTTGALLVQDVEVVHAANHAPLAIATHSSNYPSVEHTCGDIPSMEPKRYPTADVLVTTPECFVAGTLVLTERGLVPIQQVEVDDWVLTHRNRFRVVTDTMSRTADTVIVKGHGHPGLQCTATHPFYVRSTETFWNQDRAGGRNWDRRVNRPGWVPASKLQPFVPGKKGPFNEGDMWATPTVVPFQGSFVVPEVPGRGMNLQDPTFWWLAGRWLGDGSARIRDGVGESSEITICCGKHEADHLDSILRAKVPVGAKSTFTFNELRWRRREIRTAILFETDYDGLARWLVEHFGRLAHGKRLPVWALTMPENYRQALLDGYLSADGNLGKKTTAVGTVSRELAVGMRLLAEGLGNRVGLSYQDAPERTMIEGREVQCRARWLLRWRTHPERDWAITDLYEPHHAWSRINSVTPAGEATVYNIAVEEDESYVADGLVVHNCRSRSYAQGRPKDDPHLFKPGDGLEEKSRATMDEVARWADARRDQGKPYKAIVVENVPQLVDWCEPVESGHPKKCTCGTTFRRWLRDVTNLGYEHQKVFLNSAFFPPTPQSRDRIYVVFWRKGQRRPKLDFAPICWCNACQALVNGIQTPKAHLKKSPSVKRAWGPYDTVWGRYNHQYFYACPRCAHRAAPAITPAITAIEAQHTAVKIGQRAEHGLAPLTGGTLARIQRGLDGLGERPFVIPLHHLGGGNDRKPRAIDTDVLETMTAQHRSGLVVQAAGNLGRVMPDGSVRRQIENSQVRGTDQPLKTLHGSIDRGFVTTVGGPTGQSRNAQHLDEPLGTVTTDNHRALVLSQNDFGERMRDADAAPLPTLPTVARPYVLSNMENGALRDTGTEPLSTVTTGNKLYAIDPWIVPLRKNGVARPAGEAEMPTVAAAGNHLYALGVEMIVSNYGSAKRGPHQQGWARNARDSVLGTHTAKDTHAIVVYRGDGQASRIEEPMLTVATTEQHALASVAPAIEECTFRMLEPSEIARGMVMHQNAYGAPYVIHGNRRDRVRQLGNAVTPPVMRALIAAIKESLA